MYKLVIKKSAKKELDSTPEHIFLKIDRATIFKEKPISLSSKKLKDKNKRRLRVGDYRVVYSVNEAEELITIFRVRHRKDVYR